MSKETGGPAFARTGNYETNTNREYASKSQDGMTLRDYFAAKAMQADMSFEPLSPGVNDDQLGKYASHYYRIADAMLEARK